jgi:class 3 adenylate cyclase
MSSRDQVLISETTYEAVKQWVTAKPVGGRMFKGKKKEVSYPYLTVKW